MRGGSGSGLGRAGGGGPVLGLPLGNPDPTSCALLLTSQWLRFQGLELRQIG